MSSSRATALYVREHMPEIHRVLTVGERGLERELDDVGLEVVTAATAATRAEADRIDGYEAAGRPDAVIVGVDPGIDYMRLAAAADCIRGGARFIATNRDPTYPDRDAACGRVPGPSSRRSRWQPGGEPEISIGKPEPMLLLEAASAVGARAADGVMIGDGIVTDLAAAQAVGARCILMLTGVTTRAAVDALPAERPPDGRRGRRRGAGRPARVPVRRRRPTLSSPVRRCAASAGPSTRPRPARSAPARLPPRRRTSARSGASVASSAKATSSARRSIAQSSAGVRPIRSIAARYSSESVISETVMSSVERVTETPERCRSPSGCRATIGVRCPPGHCSSGTGRA